MTNFEDILQQYEPMISASIRNLHIYRDHDSFIQAGRVALWQAWNRFDATKGNFTAFAYRSIRGAMLDEMKKESKFDERFTHVDDSSLAYLLENQNHCHAGMADKIADILDILSPAERELIQSLFIEGLTLMECAKNIGISVEGIKKRRHRILFKLRSAFAIDS